MKRGLIVLGLTVSVAAADFVVSWDASTSAGDPVHEPIMYRVFKVEGGRTNFFHVDGTRITFRDPTNAAVKIWVVTVNGLHKESGPSEVLTYPEVGPPNAPVNLRITR